MNSNSGGKNHTYDSCPKNADYAKLKTLAYVTILHCQAISSWFQGSLNLIEVTLNDVESIGNNAFKECYSLERIDFGNDLKTIYSNAFESCISLKSIVFPKKFNTLQSNAFIKCVNLENISLPEEIKIYSPQFEDCNSLKNIIVQYEDTDLTKDLLHHLPNNINIYCNFTKPININEGLLSKIDRIYVPLNYPKHERLEDYITH